MGAMGIIGGAHRAHGALLQGTRRTTLARRTHGIMPAPCPSTSVRPPLP